MNQNGSLQALDRALRRGPREPGRHLSAPPRLRVTRFRWPARPSAPYIRSPARTTLTPKIAGTWLPGFAWKRTVTLCFPFTISAGIGNVTS